MKLLLTLLTITSLLLGEERTITVGVFEYYPAVFQDSSGEIKGFYVDALNEIGKSENIKFNYMYGSWAEGIERLKNNEVDLLTSVAFTEERAQFMSYGKEPLLTVWSELYTIPGSDVKSILDLEGHKVALMKNDYNGTQFRKLIAKFNIFPEYIEYPNFHSIMSAVKSGEAVAGVVSVVYGTAKYQEYGLTSTGVVANPFDIYFTVHKEHGDRQLLQLLDSYLKKWRNEKDSFYQNARAHWNFGISDSGNTIPQWVWLSFITAILIAIISAVFILLLKAEVKRAVAHIVKEEEKNQSLQEQLNQSHKMEAIGQMAGGIAHDFNNMLNGILGATELLMRRVDDKKSQKYLGMITKASKSAAELTKQMLDFSRKGKIESIPINIHDAINGVTLILKRSINKNVVIQSDFFAEKSSIMGDLNQMQNIFLNLGINASHAMGKSGGTLTFRTSTKVLDDASYSTSTFPLSAGTFLSIDIEDTGCGIETENLTKIFEPFYTTKEIGKGTGLGLSAVYGAIQQHYGAISVSSKIGIGTTFQILLPLIDTEVNTEKKANTSYHGEGVILVVDDDVMVQTLTKELLQELGYSIIVAENGVDALEKYKESIDTIDMVFMDVIMPKMDGQACFLELLRFDPNVKVVLASGYKKDTDIDSLRNQGLCGFIQKPYRLDELSKLIFEVLHRNSPKKTKT